MEEKKSKAKRLFWRYDDSWMIVHRKKGESVSRFKLYKNTNELLSYRINLTKTKIKYRIIQSGLEYHDPSAHSTVSREELL